FLSGMYPSPDALAGGTSLYQLHLTDNTAEYPVYHGSFYTSLSGISNASRAVNVAYAYEEKIEESGEGFKSSLVSPVYKNIISWIDYAEYPSAAAFAITGTYGDLLNIESGRLGVAYGDTKERIKSLSGMPLDDLVTVTIRASDQCHSDSVKQVKIADLEDFLKELNSGTGIHSYRIDIDNPDVPVRAIEQQLGALDKASINGVKELMDYAAAGSNRYPIRIWLRDDAADDGLAFVSLGADITY